MGFNTCSRTIQDALITIASEVLTHNHVMSHLSHQDMCSCDCWQSNLYNHASMSTLSKRSWTTSWQLLSMWKTQALNARAGSVPVHVSQLTCTWKHLVAYLTCWSSWHADLTNMMTCFAWVHNWLADLIDILTSRRELGRVHHICQKLRASERPVLTCRNYHVVTIDRQCSAHKHH